MLYTGYITYIPVYKLYTWYIRVYKKVGNRTHTDERMINMHHMLLLLLLLLLLWLVLLPYHFDLILLLNSVHRSRDE
jgi:hypothetical protein